MLLRPLQRCRRRIAVQLEAPVDVASLAVFRILFGLLMAASAARFVLKGWVHTSFVEPAFHFHYEGLAFIRPWPEPGMYVHFAVLTAASLGVAFGFWYRASAIVLVLAFSYVELLDKATYLNHYYLATLLAVLLACLPAGRAFSVDAVRAPERRVDRIPAWMLGTLRLQVAVVYVFAGVAKLNSDWLLAAQPLKMWLAARADLPWLGPALSAPLSAYLASWAGAAFDLSVVGLFAFRRTRRPALLIALCFHAATGLLFPIGMFPWIMSACATLFLAPDWPRGIFGLDAATDSPRIARAGRILPYLFGVHCLVQVALPLERHLRYPDSAWTLRGFNFAWNVMVAEKAGYVRFTARDRRSGAPIALALRDYVTLRQERAMAQDPSMIRALAQHIAQDLARRDGCEATITVEAHASLNGRPMQRLLDPSVDLASTLPEPWIVPLLR